MARDPASRRSRGNRRAGRTEPPANDEGKPGASGIFPPPRPFWWLPVDGQRHAIQTRDRTTATGEPVHALCGTTHPRPAPPTDAQWLWQTCELCWDEACKIVAAQ